MGASRSLKKHFSPCCACGRTEINRRKDILRLLPGLLISLIALFVVFYFLEDDLPSLAERIQQVEPLYIIAGIVLLGVGLLARSIAWRTLLEEKAPLGEVFLAINEGYLLNNIMPFRLGEFGRAWLLGQRTGLPFWHILSTIILERAFDLAISAGLLLGTLPFVLGLSNIRASAVGAASVVALGMVALHLLAPPSRKGRSPHSTVGRGPSPVGSN